MGPRIDSAGRLALRSLAAAFLIGAPLQASAQVAKPAEPVTELSSTLYEEETIGLTMRLPEGAKVNRNPESTQRLFVESFDLSWVGTLEVIQTRNDEETIAAVADRLIDASKGTTDTEKRRVKEFKTRTRETLDINGQSAEQFVLDMAFDTRDGLMREVRVYTVFKPLPGTFAIYGVRGDGTHSDAIIKATKASVNTFQFRDPAVVAREIQEGIDATNRVLAQLTADWYRKMIVPDSWYRVYSKGDGIDNETAYYRIREDIGPRGLVGTNRDQSKFTPTEAEEGLLVSQSARFLTASQSDADAYISEIEGLAWMSFDRKSEIWFTRQTTYQKVDRGYRVASRSSISGTRQGGRIDVAVSVDGVSAGNPNFTTPDAFLSQAEQHLIYRMLNPGKEGSYIMYLFRPQTADVKRRSEIIKATSNPDRFTVESRQDPSLPPTIKTINAKGDLLRMVSPDGQITEPTNPTELQRLWRAKGLPTGPINPIAESATPRR